MLYLPEHDLIELNPDAETQAGNIAVIVARTGLGETILYWDAANIILWQQKAATVGGVFIGGGIGAKILPAIQDGNFMRAFKAKGRFLPLLNKIPVKLSLNPRTPLIGAINYFEF